MTALPKWAMPIEALAPCCEEPVSECQCFSVCSACNERTFADGRCTSCKSMDEAELHALIRADFASKEIY